VKPDGSAGDVCRRAESRTAQRMGIVRIAGKCSQNVTQLAQWNLSTR